MKRAFTLIELLVVIAIIAILAAILFPVFAQAKVAAMKTACLSNLKNVAAGAMLYAGDHDDLCPLSIGQDSNARWEWDYAADVPADWRPGAYPWDVEAARSCFANSMQPYLKSAAILRAPAERMNEGNTRQYAAFVRTPEWSNFTFNGLLTEYSTSAVAAPSGLILFWQGLGNESFRGEALASPVLECRQLNAPCRYVPAHAGCDPAQNGQWSRLAYGGGPNIGMTRWVYGKGSNVAFSDGSAKFRKYGATVGGKTDFRTDPNSQYDRDGYPRASWRDPQSCHDLLFRPDFDFGDFGTPVERLDW